METQLSETIIVPVRGGDEILETSQVKFRHKDCSFCQVIQTVLTRLKKIETGEGGDRHPDDPLASANAVIWAAQNEAKLARAELLPLVAGLEKDEQQLG